MNPPSPHRNRYWHVIQKTIGNFSSHTFQQVLILSHDLSMQYADTGELKHILARQQDYPLLDLHFWLLDDWKITKTPERESFEEHLFAALTFTFMALKTQEAILDPDSFYTAAHQPLADALDQQALLHFKQLFSDSSPFWAHYHLAVSPLSNGKRIKNEGFAALPAIASALWAGKETDLPQVLVLIDHLRVIFQTIENLATLRRDVKRGIITDPIRCALKRVNAQAETNLAPEFVLGALIFTGTLNEIMQDCQEHVASARAIAIALNLSSFQAHCDETEILLQQIQALFTGKPQPFPERGELRAFFTPAYDVLQNVILKAESYLLADPAFKESWEIQQNGYISAPKLIGRPFPSSLITEILCLHGHDMSASIATALQCLQDSDFQYYDNADFLVPDADCLALAIRLIPHLKQPDHYKTIFQTPLRWMRENQMPLGQIPVWLRKNDLPRQLSELSVLYGPNCATVETNLLLGLIEYDWDHYQDVIIPCARHWCERFLASGLGVTEHYTPLYSLWAGVELITKLSAQPIDRDLQTQLRMVSDYFRERLELESLRADLTPQDASFLTLACLRHPSLSLPFNRDWITALFKNQRYDGCWEGEPIYITPAARGLNTTWHKSRAITTAFCYHALKTYESHFLENHHG